MRIVAIVFIVMLTMVNCTHVDIQRKADALSQVKPGDTQQEVFQLVGEPDLTHKINDRRAVVFYQTTPKSADDDPITTDLCTPIAFEDGVVVNVGKDLTQQWTEADNAQKRQAEIDAKRRKQAENARVARRQAEMDRQEKIRVLENKVKPVPTSNAALNLKLYRQLLELAPHNHRYQQKVAFYEDRLDKQEQTQKKRALQRKEAREHEVWEKGREARNVKLRQYSGNGTAEMAVHDMGSGSLYVWVKNVSRQIITTHPDYFTLLGSDNQKMPCEISASLDSVLEPGSISHGRIEYDKALIPKALIFENRESGRISKTFN